MDTSTEKSCSQHGLYYDYSSLVERLEREMKIVSSENRYENMASEDLQTAAEMFIYLNT